MTCMSISLDDMVGFDVLLSTSFTLCRLFYMYVLRFDGASFVKQVQGYEAVGRWYIRECLESY